MNEPSDSPKKPKRSAPVEPIKDVFASLDDEDVELGAADQARIAELQEIAKQKREAALNRLKDDLSQEADDLENKPAPADQEPAKEDDVAGKAASEPKPQRKFKLSVVEMIFSLIFLGVLAAGGIWVLKEVVSFPRSEAGRVRTDLPVQAGGVEVTQLRDFWRIPRVTGENPDRPRLDMKIIPVVEITLGQVTEPAVLRFFFRDPDGELVGDPRALEVANGVFTENGQATIQVSSTTGFTNPADYNRYVYEDLNFWSVEVMVGAPGAPTENYELLLKHDLSSEFDGEMPLDLYE